MVVNKIQKKFKKIKIVLTDVDGVLTDGGRYFSPKGEIFKKFSTVDGMGVNLLLRNGIKTAIVTKEKSKITLRWAKEMNVSKTYSGVIKKEEKIKKICSDFKVTNDEIAYIGDDINDIGLLNLVGFSATPNDGNFQVKKIVDYVCKRNSGSGAFREIVDNILLTKIPKDKYWY
jgi:YrbI family 3-deoxy-D-manno-octulosonate 8-phosphate phosphatase